MSSWKSSKEGDLPLCILPKWEILRETIPRQLLCTATFKCSLKFFTWWHIQSTNINLNNLSYMYDVYTLTILYFNSTIYSSKKAKIIGRGRDPKRGRPPPPLSRGRCMSKREMRSKRGSLPSQVDCTFSNIPTCVRFPFWRYYLVRLALNFKIRLVL